MRFEVPRYHTIQVQYKNQDKKVMTEQFSGFSARVFQHNIDLLYGRVPLNWRISFGNFYLQK